MRKFVILALATLSVASQAETIPGTNLDVSLEEAAIVGAGRTVKLLRVPVTDELSKQVRYYNITFNLTAENGELEFDRIENVELESKFISPSSFSAGIYQDSRGNTFELVGPSIGVNGLETYSLVQFGDYTQISSLSASWTTAPAAQSDLAQTAYYNNYAALFNTYNFGSISYSELSSYNTWDPKTRHVAVNSTSATGLQLAILTTGKIDENVSMVKIASSRSEYESIQGSE